MIDLDNTLLIQLVNFLITVIVLNLILIRPIRAKLAERAKLMADQAGVIENFNSNAEEKLKSYEAALDGARREGLELRKKMRSSGTEEEQQILSTAGKDVASMMEASQTEVAGQVAAAEKALSADVEKYATEATAKILGRA